MHIYFSGIGGVGIGPLALIAKQAGYEVSGSDLQDGQYIKYLREQGITDINIGQSRNQIFELNIRKPIDWFVYSSALPKTNPHHPEILFCQENDIKMSKRDELLNKILEEKNLKLIAIAGTHGKTTTTSMVVWLFKKLGLPVSYSLGAKISFGDMGAFDPKSEYFVYECDEFDRNFLAFHPYLSIISGVAYDHHEIFPTEENYQTAFRDFISQSQNVVMWQDDYTKLKLPKDNKFRKL
jgi:UDP-N-acetylmuramate--alanine ligase